MHRNDMPTLLRRRRIISSVSRNRMRLWLWFQYANFKTKRIKPVHQRRPRWLSSDGTTS